MAFAANATVIAALWMLLGGAARAQPEITLQQVSSRMGGDFVPAYQDRQVTVRGTVSTLAIPVLDWAHIAIQDDERYGLILKAPAADLSHLKPGHAILVRGTIVKHGGMPVLVPSEIQVLAEAAPPEPHRASLAHVTSFRYMGVLVETEGDVTGAGENAGGDFINLGDPVQPLKIFLPAASRKSRAAARGFANGDRVRVTGLAMQYCLLPPHNRQYQVLIGNLAAARIIEGRWLAPPGFLLAALILLIGALGAWWIRERRMAKQSESMRALNALSEDILNAESAVDIAARLSGTLPRIWNVSGAHLFLFNKGTRTLDRVKVRPDGETLSLPIDASSGSIAAGAALCFRNRTVLAMPDTRKNPFWSPGENPKLPRALLFVPAYSQNELLAVLEIESDPDPRQFSRDEQAAAQHLGNLVAAALRLQEQLSAREHLFRGERVAASGQLISGVAAELGSPLEAIAKLTGKLVSGRTGPEWGRDLHALSLETLRATEIVARLLGLAKSDRSIAEPIDLREIVKELISTREREHKLAGIEVRELASSEAVPALGSRVQLEQVALNLLLQAERTISADRTLTIATNTRGKRVILEISFPVEPKEPSPGENPASPEGSGLSMAVCHGIIQNHGGSLRILRSQPCQCRFEMELPAARPSAPTEPSPQSQSRAARQLTALIIEPDPAMQRRLIRMLDARGHRAVPIASSEEGVEVAQLVRFDVSFCSMNVESLNWVQFFQRVRHSVGAFVLLTESHDPDLTRIFDDGGGYLLTKPVSEADLDHLLDNIINDVGSQAMVGNA